MATRVFDQSQDRRVIRTRGLILEAFEDLMAEKSFEELSIGDLTERAGVNRATFYAHFQDKIEVLRQRVCVSFEKTVDEHELRGRSLDRESLSELFLTLCAFLDRMRTGSKPPHEHLDWLLETHVKDHMARLIAQWETREGNSAARPPSDNSSESGESPGGRTESEDPHENERRSLVLSWALYSLAEARSLDPEIGFDEYGKRVLPLIWPIIPQKLP